MKEKSDREAVLRYAEDTYGTTPEYLWKRTPNYAVLRNQANRKWYGAIIDIPRKTLGLTGEGIVDILDIKCSPVMIGSLLEQEGYLPAYQAGECGQKAGQDKASRGGKYHVHIRKTDPCLAKVRGNGICYGNNPYIRISRTANTVQVDSGARSSSQGKVIIPWTKYSKSSTASSSRIEIGGAAPLL